VVTPLDTVERLISLALDEQTNQDEARNAAVTAVRLIRKHNLLIEEFQVGRARKTCNQVSLKKLQRLADEKANQMVSELVNRSIAGAYPTVTASSVVEDAIHEGLIQREQYEVFYRQLKVSLLSKVRRGIIVSKSGFSGGYQLSRSRKLI
jgi:hypothetical protein